MVSTNVVLTGELLSRSIKATLAGVKGATSTDQARAYRETLVDLLLIHERMLGRVHPVDAELPEAEAALLDA